MIIVNSIFYKYTYQHFCKMKNIFILRNLIELHQIMFINSRVIPFLYTKAKLWSIVLEFQINPKDYPNLCTSPDEYILYVHIIKETRRLWYIDVSFGLYCECIWWKIWEKLRKIYVVIKVVFSYYWTNRCFISNNMHKKVLQTKIYCSQYKNYS